MNKTEELKKMDRKKLEEELAEMQKNYFKVKFEVKTGQSKNSHQISLYKTQIARLKTILREKAHEEKPIEKEDKTD
jgi:large subunit ribosomal protein L29